MGDSSPSPPPYSWPPSGRWDGWDGLWSTFLINVGDYGNGDRGQSFRVLVSTSNAHTTIPGVSDSCGSSEACESMRGIEVYHSFQSSGFNETYSSTWQDLGPFQIGESYMPDPYALSPLTGEDFQFGIDTVGTGGASVISQVILGSTVAMTGPTLNPFLGSVGLSITTPDQANGRPSTAFSSWLLPLYSGWNYQNIPSLSYGYTVGAYYANGSSGLLGSLTLGGYDQSRFHADQYSSIGLGSADEMVVEVVGMYSQVGNQSQRAISTEPFEANITTDTPFLYLPDTVCDTIEDIYSLNYNSIGNTYAPDNSSDALRFGSNLTFELGSSNSTRTVNISLPIEALTLPFRVWPNNSNPAGPAPSNAPFNDSHPVFPIRKLSNSSVTNFLLGRAFLQQAYLIVDYGRRNFTLAAAAMSDLPLEPDIRAITNGSETTRESPSDQPSGPKLTTGARVGIAFGVTTAATIIAMICYFCFRRAKRAKSERADTAEQKHTRETYAKPELDGEEVGELNHDTMELNGEPMAELGGITMAELQGSSVGELEATSRVLELPGKS